MTSNMSERVHDVGNPVAGQTKLDSTLRNLLQHRNLIGTTSNAPDDRRHLPASGSHLTVLVVDDDATLLTTFAGILEHTYRVVTAADGTEAIAKFEGTAVDVVVTDLAMPGMNGLQLASRCKAIRPTVPVLMITAWEALIEPAEAWEHGIDGILTKPVRAATLVGAIQELAQQ